MSLYFNDNDPTAAGWLRELYPAATVDDRSIADVSPDDVVGYQRAHWFGGIGGWEYALSLAGWPADRPVWTGSCPCQPFSAAGKRQGAADHRHLWPEWLRLITLCRPDTLFGEQVDSRLGRDWLAGVQADLEAVGYAVGVASLNAAGVGAPHIRQRLYWVAHACGSEWRGWSGADGRSGQSVHAPDSCASDRLEYADRPGWPAGRPTSAALGYRHTAEPASGAGGLEYASSDGRQQRRAEPGGRSAVSRRHPGWLAHSTGGAECTGKSSPVQRPLSAENGTADWLGHSDRDGQQEHRQDEPALRDREASPWSASPAILCADGRWRRVPPEPALQPLAARLPGRVGMLRGAGNSIVPQLAAAFIRAYLEAERELTA